MDEPKPLDSLFKEKLFRIPDYQRGYAWGREQLNAFWEDLVNLPDGRSHYTGVLTLKEIPASEVHADSKEFWLVDDHSYKLYHIVDGQQRLTTFALFLQAFIELLRSLPENRGLADDAIMLTDTLSIAAVESKFLFEVKPAGKAFRTYKFGYTVDNPSYEYMRYRILGEGGAGNVFETFYTLNLSNGKHYFKEQLRAWHDEEGITDLQNLYRTLTRRFLFNEYIIKDEFDVFVAFETMNNRGTPHHWHAPIAVRALDAGKHVYLEKPASHVFREGRLLVEAANRSGRILQHGTQMRSSDVTAEAGKVLASGLLGEIKMAKAWGVEPRGHHPEPVADEPPPESLDWNRWLGPAPERPFNPIRFRRWNSYREYGNGEIGGDGVHDIDMARWGLGATAHPVRITAHGSRVHLKGESDFPDNMLVTYEYDDGKVLVYENRNFAPYKEHGWDNGNVFYGTEGYMIFSRRGYFQTYLGAKEEQGPGLRGGDGVQEHVRGFVDCVRTGRQPKADADTAHLSCALVHLGEIAYRTRRALDFNPQSETFRGDEQANRLLSKTYRGEWGLDS